MKCPHCGKTVSVKGHAGGLKDFRHLTREQQRASIANTARNLKRMREIYHGQSRRTQPQTTGGNRA